MDRSVSSQWTRSVVGVHGPGVSLFGSPVLFNIFTALEGILSWDSYVVFIGVVNMMARKSGMINGRTMSPNACLSWPYCSALPL